MSNRTIPSGLIALGSQKISMSGTAVYSLNSTCDGADVVVLSVETANVRARWDGVSPAASTGILLETNLGPYAIDINAAGLKLTAASGSPVVNVAAFRYAGNRAR